MQSPSIFYAYENRQAIVGLPVSSYPYTLS